MYDAAMPNIVPMGQALASSQSQSGRGVESGRGYPAPAAAGTGFLMLPPVGSSSSLAYGSSGGGHSSGSSFGPAVHGYGRSGAAPVAFGSSPPFWFGDVGGNAQQTVPMQTTHNRPQHDAMRMPSATAPPPPSWGPSPGLVANSAAGFAGGVWVPMGWHGGGVTVFGGGGGVQQSGGGQHQQHGFGMTPIMGARPKLPPVLPSFDKWTDAPLPRDDHGNGGGSGGGEKKENEVAGELSVL